MCELDVVLYGTVIDGLCKDMKIDTTLKLFDEMCDKGISPNVIVYNTLIRGLCNLSRWEQVHVLLAGMIDQKIYPDVFTFNGIVDALCKKGLVNKAEDVLLMMMQNNVVPDVVSYKIDDVIHLFMEMHKKGLRPNLVTYTSLLQGLCRVDELERKGEDLHVTYYSILMDGLCGVGKHRAAGAMFNDLHARGLKPDVITYSILIKGCCRNGLLEEASIKKKDDAMHLVFEMQRKGLRPNVVAYTYVLQGLFRVGRCSTALDLFDELQTVGLKPNFYTYCNLLHGLCHNQHSNLAFMLLDEMERKGEDRNVAYYTILMDALCRTGKLRAAEALFNELHSRGFEPDVVAYTILINGCCRNRLFEEARNLHLEMEQAGLMPNVITYTTMLRGYMQKYDEVAIFVEEMDAKGFFPDSSVLGMLLDLAEKVEVLNRNVLTWHQDLSNYLQFKDMIDDNFHSSTEEELKSIRNQVVTSNCNAVKLKSKLSASNSVGEKNERKLSRQDRIELGRLFQGAVSSHDCDLAESLILLTDPQTLNDALCVSLHSIWFSSTQHEMRGIAGLIKKIIANGAYDFTRAFLVSCVSACKSQTMSPGDTVTVMSQRYKTSPLSLAYLYIKEIDYPIQENSRMKHGRKPAQANG
ncbi:hypothetical protein ACS0TY_025635 [Phlomoides rotata]